MEFKVGKFYRIKNNISFDGYIHGHIITPEVIIKILNIGEDRVTVSFFNFGTMYEEPNQFVISLDDINIGKYSEYVLTAEDQLRLIK
jgi:hypothetical protein